MSVEFQLEGEEFIALNGGPQYKFTPAISFSVNCKTQQEVDDLWARLSEGGTTNRCGWADRQIRTLVANCAHCAGLIAGRQGFSKIGKSHEGHAPDDQARD
jgi:3-demethylubiquinone-9 3-methyltransferase